MTTREELDARLAEFDRRRADADALTVALTAERHRVQASIGASRDGWVAGHPRTR